MFSALSALVLLGLVQNPAPVAPPTQQRPSPSSWIASDLQIVSDERDSLRGVSRLAVAVSVPDELVKVLPRAALQSMIVFRLEQAGLTVVAAREIEDPLLSISVHVVSGQGGAAAGADWVAYRISTDFMQLVRLKDEAAKARFMLASTWQVATHGVAPAASGDELRARVTSMVDAFLEDRRGTSVAPRVLLP